MGNFTQVIDANDEQRKKAKENLLLLINQDEEFLKEEDFILHHNFIAIRWGNDKEKLLNKLWELEVHGFIYLSSSDIEGVLEIKEWDIDRILNKTIDYMAMHAWLSVLIKDKNAFKRIKLRCCDIEKPIKNISLQSFISFFNENQFDFSDLELAVVAIRKKEETEKTMDKIFYQMELKNNEFDPDLFKEYITLEQLNNERNHLPDQNKYLFSLLNFLLERGKEMSLKGDKASALLKLILVLAAQHSLDAVFNVVLTLILNYWEKDKLYKANVIWIKNQLLDSSANLDSLLNLCDAKDGPLYKMLNKLNEFNLKLDAFNIFNNKNVSADQLFLCVPDDKAGELYEKAVFGAITAFNSAAPHQVSTLVMLRLGPPFEEITVTNRLQDSNGFRLVSRPFHYGETYGFLSMEKLNRLKAMTPGNATHVLEKNLKSFEQINLNGNNEQQNAEESQANPFDQLPDETLLNIFRFFNLREKFKLGEVSKRFYALSRDRKYEETQYKKYKTVQGSLDRLSTKELEEAIKKLSKTVEETMQELNRLPNWYGDINKEQAELILDQFPNYSYLLRNAEDIEGALVISYKEVIESDEASCSAKTSSSPFNPVLRMEGALILPKEKKDISLPENVREPSSSNFKHGLIRMIEGYDDKFYFMFGCFQSMAGYSSLSEIIKHYERDGFTPACMEDFSPNKAPKI